MQHRDSLYQLSYRGSEPALNQGVGRTGENIGENGRVNQTEFRSFEAEPNGPPGTCAAPRTSAPAKASRPLGHPWLVNGEPREYYPLYNLSVPADEGLSIRGWANPT